jgi:3-dehydroquinate dehydratase II
MPKAAPLRLLVIHGPNLNLLGEREPEVYGTQTLADVDALVGSTARALGIDVRCVQHNGEGAIIDELHGARTEYDAVILNAGAYSHYSYAIADAIAGVRIPVIEVHLSNVASRELFRRTSVVATACAGTISGFGATAYVLAVHAAQSLAK